LIIDNVTGCLAKPAFSLDLARKTLNLVRNEEKTNKMGKNAKKTIETLYNSQIVGSKMEHVLKEI
jgi:hypothetical protein